MPPQSSDGDSRSDPTLDALRSLLDDDAAAHPEESATLDSELDALRDLLDDEVSALDEEVSNAPGDSADLDPELNAPRTAPDDAHSEPRLGAVHDAALATAADVMKTHRTVVGVSVGIFGVLIGGSAVVGGVALLSFGGVLGSSISELGAVVTFLGGLVALLGLTLGFVLIRAGVQFPRDGSRGRIPAYLTAILLLLGFPIFTGLGGYMIWVLLRTSATRSTQTAVGGTS